MAFEENKVIAHQFTEAHNLRNIDKLRNLLSSGFVSHISDRVEPLDCEYYLQAIEATFEAFSDLTFTIDDVIAEGEKVVLRLTARGQHTGEYYGISPTGRQIAFSGIVIRRIADGKVAEEWQTNDQLSLIRQIGLKVKDA